MSNKEECAAYFKGKKEWERVFSLLRKKWESYGRCGGTVVLVQATGQERRALEGFFTKSMPAEDIRISLRDFEQALQQTKFATVTLKELLDAYFGEELFTNRAKTEQRQAEREQFYEEMISGFSEGNDTENAVTLWLRRQQETKQHGYSTVWSEYGKSKEAAKLLIQTVGKALLLAGREAEDGIPLAVLASEASGNPHAFDRGSTAGTLFLQALCCLDGCGFPQTAYEWRGRLLQHGIWPDEVSNTVMTYGLHLETDKGLHPAFEGFAKLDEPGVLTSAALQKTKRIRTETGCVFAVENQMVFGWLLEKLAGQKVTLLCTAGQPRTLAIKLFELLEKEEIFLFYSGDMDPEGMRIADRLWTRFPGIVRIWRMGAADYETALSQETVSERRLSMLDTMQNPVLAETAQLLRKQKYVAYQEKLLEKLLEDIKGGWQ